MPSDLAGDRGPAGEPPSIWGGELKSRIRAELAECYAWPPALAAAAMPLQDLSAVMDLDKLADVAASVVNARELSFAIISKEYLQTGLNWIYAMHRLGLHNFLMIAGDRFTSEMLDERGVPNVLVDIDESDFDPSFVSTTGFSAKGLAVSALKFPVSRFLVASGYSVVMSDADAVWLQDPAPYLRDTDVAFQRILYHPPAISVLWGFGACGGFISFRKGARAIAFLDRCIEEQRFYFCDQVAMNLALLEGNPDWHCEHADWVLPASGVQQDRGSREAAFAKCARFPITGELRHGGLHVLALPHDKFWRHALVPIPPRDLVVCHPNSPKDDLEKVNLLASMGVRFQPVASDLPWPRERDHATD